MAPLLRHVRSLRFRLSVSYVLFFAVLLAGTGAFFRQTLAVILEGQSRALLDEEWAAILGFLRFEKRQPRWYFDRADPEESAVVARLLRTLLLTDAEGTVLWISPDYELLGRDRAADIKAALRAQQIQWRTRRNAQGVPYLVRSGAVNDERKREYFMAIGMPLSSNERILQQFTWYYFAALPLMLVATGLLGWVLAGRALQPVGRISAAAQRISGQNLDVRIPTRRAGDELDELIESFNRMIERLRESFEQIRQFSTDASHELRTPLTAIRGQLEVALLTAQTAEQYREAVLNALEDVERLSQIVRALLMLSQAESGRLVLQKAPVDLTRAVQDIVDQFQIPAEAARLRLSAELEPSVALEADPVQMDRLITNLVSNAVKYTPAEGRVTVRLRRAEGQIELEVEDSGQGIPAADLPHIFDRFYRVHSADQSPEKGLGLGLSFVAWIVKAHGGTIQVESEEGRGSRFSVRLPAG